MSALIQAESLSRDYAIRSHPLAKPRTLHALAEASFSVEAGSTLAVVGESGCGKSTLARLLTLIEPASSGALRIAGHEVSAKTMGKDATLRSMVQIVFQNPYGSLNPRHRVGAILEEPLRINTKLSAAERRERASSLLAEVGLRPEHYGRYPHMFSGGQRQRIAIARALILEPKILVLDEPVSALDVSIQAQILNLLSDLQERKGLTYVFISHDLSVVRHVADRVMVMYLGRPVEIADAQDLFAAPQHPYTRALLSATPVADPSRREGRLHLSGELPSPFNPPTGCAFHPRCPFAEARCRVELPLMPPAPSAQTAAQTSSARAACHGVEEGRV